LHLHAFLTSALDGGEWSASRPGRFIPSERAPWYQLDRRLGGPQSPSGRGGGEKNAQPLPELKPPIIQPVAQHYTTELSRRYSSTRSTRKQTWSKLTALCHFPKISLIFWSYRLFGRDTQNTRGNENIQNVG
jgi:hypothetical protein